MHAWAGNALDGANYDFLNAINAEGKKQEKERKTNKDAQ